MARGLHTGLLPSCSCIGSRAPPHGQHQLVRIRDTSERILSLDIRPKSREAHAATLSVTSPEQRAFVCWVLRQSPVTLLQPQALWVHAADQARPRTASGKLRQKTAAELFPLGGLREPVPRQRQLSRITRAYIESAKGVVGEDHTANSAGTVIAVVMVPWRSEVPITRENMGFPACIRQVAPNCQARRVHGRSSLERVHHARGLKRRDFRSLHCCTEPLSR